MLRPHQPEMSAPVWQKVLHGHILPTLVSYSTMYLLCCSWRWNNFIFRHKCSVKSSLIAPEIASDKVQWCCLVFSSCFPIAQVKWIQAQPFFATGKDKLGSWGQWKGPVSKYYCFFIVKNTIEYSNCYHTIIMVSLFERNPFVCRFPFTGTVTFLLKPRKNKCASSALCWRYNSNHSNQSM